VFVLRLNPDEGRLYVDSFISSRIAARFLKQTERWIQDTGSAVDVVLVRAESLTELRQAFPNYYSDTDRFIEILESAIAY